MDIEKNKLVTENNELVGILKDEYGVEIVPYEADHDEKQRTLIPVPQDVAAELSIVTSAFPTLAANAAAQDALGKTAYAITFNGKDVHPEQLWQKKNGSYISNLKGENGHWGKQTDVNAIDNTATQGAMVASSVFAVAAMATSMYYMKNINDKLADLQETVQDVIAFLENDKQSQIETDMETLKDIASHMQTIKSNKDLKQVKMQQFSALQREAKKNVRFYEKQLRASLDQYIVSKKDRKEKSALQKLRKEYFYYRICLLEYAVSKMIEIQITNSFSTSQLQNARSEIEKLSDKHKTLNNKLLSEIYGHRLDSLEAKALRGLSNTLDFMGGVIRSTPLGKTEIDEALIKLGKQSGNAVKNRTKKQVDQILSKEDYGIIDPIVESIQQMESTYHKPLELVRDGDDTFIAIPA